MAEVHGLNPTEPPQDAADGLGLKQDFNSSGTCIYIYIYTLYKLHKGIETPKFCCGFFGPQVLLLEHEGLLLGWPLTHMQKMRVDP